MNSRSSNSLPIILAASLFLSAPCVAHAAEGQRRLKLVFITCCVDRSLLWSGEERYAGRRENDGRRLRLHRDQRR